MLINISYCYWSRTNVLVYGPFSRCIFQRFFKSDIFNFIFFCNICCKNISSTGKSLEKICIGSILYWKKNFLLNITYLINFFCWCFLSLVNYFNWNIFNLDMNLYQNIFDSDMNLPWNISASGTNLVRYESVRKYFWHRNFLIFFFFFFFFKH